MPKIPMAVKSFSRTSLSDSLAKPLFEFYKSLYSSIDISLYAINIVLYAWSANFLTVLSKRFILET